jgi:hypothetical protein
LKGLGVFFLLSFFLGSNGSSARDELVDKFGWLFRDAKLSTELEAAREAAAAETQRAKDMAQAELDAKNEELKKQPAATTGADSKGLSPEVEAARQAAAVESQRAKEETQLKISLENQEQQQSRLFVTGVDSKELSPEVLAARKAAAAESQRSKEQAQAKIDAENREMKKMLAVASGADSKGKAAGKSRAGWSKVGATVRFMQSASFAQQREETLPGDALALEREREATRARLHPTEALSGAERDYWQAQAPSAFAAAGATLEIQNEMRPMSAPLQGASPPSTPTAPTAQKEMRPRSGTVRSAKEMRAWARSGDPYQEQVSPMTALTEPTVPDRALLRSLSATGLKYNSQSGMWLRPSLADVAAAAAELHAPGARPLKAGGAPGAPGTRSLGALLGAKPRGKPPSFGGLSSSGLKFDPTSGFWLPPGARRPPLGKPPLVGGLSSGGFPGLRCERTRADPSTLALAPTLSLTLRPLDASQVRPEEWLLAAAGQGAERCHPHHAAAGWWSRLGRAEVHAAD